MKVYIVTSGEYSDYRIEKVFTDRESARLYALTHFGRYDYAEVEEYDTEDEYSVDAKYFKVDCGFSGRATIDSLTLASKYAPPAVDYLNGVFTFYVSISNKRLYNSIIAKGDTSPVLMKIVQDAFAQYEYENGMTPAMMQKKHEEVFAEDYQKKYGRYPSWFCSSSTVVEPLKDPVGAKLTEIIDNLIATDQPLPDYNGLLRMAADVKEELDGKGNG